MPSKSPNFSQTHTPEYAARITLHVSHSIDIDTCSRSYNIQMNGMIMALYDCLTVQCHDIVLCTMYLLPLCDEFSNLGLAVGPGGRLHFCVLCLFVRDSQCRTVTLGLDPEAFDVEMLTDLRDGTRDEATKDYDTRKESNVVNESRSNA